MDSFADLQQLAQQSSSKSPKSFDNQVAGVAKYRRAGVKKADKEWDEYVPSANLRHSTLLLTQVTDFIE